MTDNKTVEVTKHESKQTHVANQTNTVEYVENACCRATSRKSRLRVSLLSVRGEYCDNHLTSLIIKLFVAAELVLT